MLLAATRRLRISDGTVPRSIAVATDADRQNRARRADDAVEARRDDVPEVAVDLLADVPHHLALVAAAERIGRHEAFGQADDADLEAAGELDLLAGARA